jgi:ADP-ribose 1''-phosphate phosphatase
MSSLIIKKMDLFEAPKGSILVHACNAQGVWGSGIAVGFRERFPDAYEAYSKYCKDFGFIGTAPLFQDRGYFIGCLITSSGYAGTLDEKDVILVNTTLALNQLCADEHWAHFGKRQIYSNKFNSGLFKVPWRETERILKVLVDRYDLTWTVCDPNMEEEEIVVLEP